MQVQGCTLFNNDLYALSIGFHINSLLVETRVKSTLYTPVLYWSGARHWAKLVFVALVVLRLVPIPLLPTCLIDRSVNIRG
jgi:hypothetical protein